MWLPHAGAHTLSVYLRLKSIYLYSVQITSKFRKGNAQNYEFKQLLTVF